MNSRLMNPFWYFGKASSLWEKYKFGQLQSQIDPRTVNNHKRYLNWAQEEIKGLHRQSLDNQKLQVPDEIKKLRVEFKDKLREMDLRILIHLPSISVSPGGYSLFSNLIETLNYLGIETRSLNWNDNLQESLREFSPDFFLSSDNAEYINRIDWTELNKFKETHSLKVGLTASIEAYGNTPLKGRLKRAKLNKIDFYYSFRDRAYLSYREEYKEYSDAGYPIFSIPFGANILKYYPLIGYPKELDFVFFGSSNIREYTKYFSEIFRNYSGFIAGNNWKNFGWVGADIQRLIYAKAKVGLNIHSKPHREWAAELNERCYILAACGVPQIIDDTPLLSKFFSHDELYVAGSPKEYISVFKFALHDEKESRRRALNAQRKVLNNYTSFHRVEQFIKEVRNNIKTDLSYETLMHLAKSFNYFRNGNIKLHVLPGSPKYIGKASYFIADKDKLNILIKKIKDISKNFSNIENQKMMQFIKELQPSKEVLINTREVKDVQSNTKESKESSQNSTSKPQSR